MEKEISDLDIMKALSYRNYYEFKCKYDVIFRDNNVDYLSACKLLESVSIEDKIRCTKLLHNRYVRKSRIYKCINWMIENGKVCYFCTFTLNEDSINLSLKYLRGELTKRLDLLNTWFLGNVDYGELYGRMHFP